jgi:hypothetical protein
MLGGNATYITALTCVELLIVIKAVLTISFVFLWSLGVEEDI